MHMTRSEVGNYLKGWPWYGIALYTPALFSAAPCRPRLAFSIACAKFIVR